MIMTQEQEAEEQQKQEAKEKTEAALAKARAWPKGKSKRRYLAFNDKAERREYAQVIADLFVYSNMKGTQIADALGINRTTLYYWRDNALRMKLIKAEDIERSTLSHYIARVDIARDVKEGKSVTQIVQNRNSSRKRINRIIDLCIEDGYLTPDDLLIAKMPKVIAKLETHEFDPNDNSPADFILDTQTSKLIDTRTGTTAPAPGILQISRKLTDKKGLLLNASVRYIPLWLKTSRGSTDGTTTTKEEKARQAQGRANSAHQGKASGANRHNPHRRQSRHSSNNLPALRSKHQKANADGQSL